MLHTVVLLLFPVDYTSDAYGSWIMGLSFISLQLELQLSVAVYVYTELDVNFL